MKFINLINKKNEVVGMKLLFDYDNKRFYVSCQGYEVLTDKEKTSIKKDLYNRMKEYKKEIETEKQKKQEKKQLEKLLNMITRKEYLNLDDMRKLIKFNIDITFMYDIISGLSEFRETKKGIVSIDSMNNKCYFYNDNYKFYKECFMI